MEVRSFLLQRLSQWLADFGMTQGPEFRMISRDVFDATIHPGVQVLASSSRYSRLVRNAAVLLVTAAAMAGAVDDGREVCAASHEVGFVSRGVTLRGTLCLPASETLVAAVVLVEGAGQKTRNLGFARLLARFGIATLTYDKRGVGASGGVYAGREVGTNNVSRENLDLLAADAAAAVRALRGEPRLRTVPRGLVGVSQAGWIIPLAALKDREVRALLRATVDQVPWPDFDPREALSLLRIPGLWVFGGRDRNVDVDLSIERLQALVAAGHSNYSYTLWPNYDHQLGGINPDVTEPAVAWIAVAVGRGRTRGRSAKAQ